MQTLLQDLALQHWPLTREIMIAGTQHRWDLDAAPLRETAFNIWAAPSETKGPLENVFAWLRDASDRQSKANRMSYYTKFLYNFICPYAASNGNQVVKPTFDDVATWDAEDYATVFALKPFKPGPKFLWRAHLAENAQDGRLPSQQERCCSGRVHQNFCRDKLCRAAKCVGRFHAQLQLQGVLR